ncbi:hypothetical protein BGZ63DRAFT_406620 [Mariannaea sp. PMI_226]|nr:hypothetical protein BGZ63DRAFT_406620 [Mariannaea sp. PMI_226]
MDPPSIATSAATLARTAGAVSLWFFDLINNINIIDTNINDLSKEVERLTALLESVKTVVQQCQSQALTLAYLDGHMWRQIDNALIDCKINIEGLQRLTIRLNNEINPEAKSLATLLKKPSTHFHFNVHKDKITEYTGKVYKSNCAVQTALAVVNVSLIFRTNVSQERLFQELETLKEFFQAALTAANRTEVDQDSFSSRQNRNLKSLARAAQHFHSHASSTASSRYGPSRASYSSSLWGSDFGGLSDFQRDRIEQWNDVSTVEESTEGGTVGFSGPSNHSAAFTYLDTGGPSQNSSKKHGTASSGSGDKDEEESDVEIDSLTNLKQLARTNFDSQNYAKTEQCLRLALERSTSDPSVDFRQLKTQLALCYCLQEKWSLAEAILAPLTKTESPSNLPVFHLLQAIALAQLQSHRFDDAYLTCKRVLQGKKRIVGRHSYDYHKCLLLFATICEKRGDMLKAEAVRHSVPRGGAISEDLIQVPTQYILTHATLIDLVFPKNHQAGLAPKGEVTDTNTIRPRSPLSANGTELDSELTIAGRRTRLAPKRSGDGIYLAENDERKGFPAGEMDTGKESSVQSVPRADFTFPFDGKSDSTAGGPSQATGKSYAVTSNRQTLMGSHETTALSDDSRYLHPNRYHQQLIRNSSVQSPQQPSPKKHIKSPYLHTDIPSSDSSVPGKVSGQSSLSVQSFPRRLNPSQSRAVGNRNKLIRRINGRTLLRNMDTLRIADELTVNSQGAHSQSSSLDTADGPSPSMISPTRPFNRPSEDQGLELLVHQMQDAQITSAKPNIDLIDEVKDLPTLPQTVVEGIQRTVTSDSHSTLEVATNASNHSSRPSRIDTALITRVKSSIDMACQDSLRIRWTVQKDIGNIGRTRPFGRSGTPQFLPICKESPSSGACFVGVCIGFETPTSIILRRGQTGITICEMPAISTVSPRLYPDPTAGPQSGLKIRDGVFRKMIPFARKVSPLADTSVYSVDVSSLRDWLDELGTGEMTGEHVSLFGDMKELHNICATAARHIELEIANLLRQGQVMEDSGTIASLRLERLVYALPDFIDRTAWMFWTSILAECPLLQHAKVIPQSFAVVQYFLDNGLLFPNYEDLEQNIQIPIVVLNCGEMLVDCIPYYLQKVSPSFVKITESPSSYMAELTGLKHVQAEFAKLVEGQLKQMTRELRRRIDNATMEKLVESCCEQFQQNIFPHFENNGREWTVEFEMPQTIPGLQHGRLKFSNAEMLKCFEPSTRMITTMLLRTVQKFKYNVSSILLSGPYLKSKYLRDELKEVTDRLWFKYGILKSVPYEANYEDVCVPGVWSHAISS